MVKLNHTTIVDNKPVTPFLIQGSNVYCFNNIKETVILPLSSFKTKKTKKAPVVPKPVFTKQVIPKPVLQKPEPPVEETIIIKPKLIHTKIAGGSIRTIGSADYSHIIVKTPVIMEPDKPAIYKYKPAGFIKVFGTADTKHRVFKSYEKNYEGIVQAIGVVNSKVEAAELIPPVVDNSRYIRPTLDNDYI